MRQPLYYLHLAQPMPLSPDAPHAAERKSLAGSGAADDGPERGPPPFLKLGMKETATCTQR